SIADLTPKVTGRPKLQCLEILAAYVSDARRNERVASVFDTVGLVEMTNTREALALIRNGLHLMEENLRKRIVSQVAGTCQQLPVKVRSVAYGVLVKALQLLLSTEPKEPFAKRRARESNSLLLSLSDAYTETVLTGVAQGLVDGDAEISESVREGVGGCLSEDCGV
ncbi:jg23857, partial [Pararge aegeria aegeria]